MRRVPRIPARELRIHRAYRRAGGGDLRGRYCPGGSSGARAGSARDRPRRHQDRLRAGGRGRAPSPGAAPPDRALGRPGAPTWRAWSRTCGSCSPRRRRAGGPRRVGVSVPGPFDPETGTVLRPPNLPGWDATCRSATGWRTPSGGRCTLENDANAAALAEWRFGAGRGSRHLVYLTMSTGVGAGLVLDGRLYRGVRAGAGEIGHVPVEWDGEPCALRAARLPEAYVGGASPGRGGCGASRPRTSRVVARSPARASARRPSTSSPRPARATPSRSPRWRATTTTSGGCSR